MRMFRAAKVAMKAGIKQGQTTGDTMQLGGMYLIDPDQGVVFSHVEEYAGHQPKLDDVLVAASA